VNETADGWPSSDTRRSLTPKGKETRERIFSAAITLINRDGFDAVSLQEICTAAGVSVGSFYHHFRSKHDLLVAYVREESDEIAILYAGLTGSARERIRRTVHTFFSFYLVKGPAFVSAFYAAILATRGELFLPRDFSLFSVLETALQEGKDGGEFRADLPIEVMQSLIVGLIWEITIRWTMKRETVGLLMEANRSVDVLLDLFAGSVQQ